MHFLTCFSLLQGLRVQITLAENGALLLPLIGKLGRLVARVIELIPCGGESVTKKFGREKLDGFELLCQETVTKKNF